MVVPVLVIYLFCAEVWADVASSWGGRIVSYPSGQIRVDPWLDARNCCENIDLFPGGELRVAPWLDARNCQRNQDLFLFGPLRSSPSWPTPFDFQVGPPSETKLMMMYLNQTVENLRLIFGI